MNLLSHPQPPPSLVFGARRPLRRTPVLSPLGRLLAGAVYGGLLGSLFALVSATINLVVTPDVPLYIHWPTVWQNMLLTGLGGVMVGAVTARPHETLRGLLNGTLALVTLSAGYMLIQARFNIPMLAYVFVTFLMSMVINVPIALGLRLTVQLQDRILERTGRQRLWMQSLLLLAIVAAAVIAGSRSDMPPEAVSAVRRVNALLTDVLIENRARPLPFALRTIHDFRERATPAYALDQRASLWQTGDIEVRARFENGYVVACLVLPFDIVCSEGEDAFAVGDGPAQ